ncbi:L-threonylcarbamoyladenylate synthase [Cohnella rhizosphaerae]|uniref:Threonylcarbamoyl-AMP synthase n=1 Tax=Cohnella rhizosphaerae TaxID=1457232 RepID=A0A9X4KWQ3_9BACL|nr:L-threonylcarbamoyladenylate synthase [Cohnella rhizosphaerae]MDG0811741.1 L-threonylcarbamoyladenylate synthase [Cohnella rhizosphaerae]
MHTKTKYWTPADGDAGLNEAAAALAAGGVVAFPTETVYGLGADARSEAAAERIFAAKGRPSDNPLIVHLAEAADVDALAAEVSPLERTLMAAFWPGPLTLVLPVRSGAVAARVTAGLDTVAVRVPAHETARRLIAAAGCPVAAPSANRSGRPSPTLARHVRDDLDGRIDGVLDGGPTGVGVESTVVRVLGDDVHILRPGGVTAEQLREAAGGAVRIAASDAGETDRIAVSGAGDAVAGGGADVLAEWAGAGEGASAAGTGAARAAGAVDAAGTAGASGAAGAIGATVGDAAAADALGAPRSPGVKYAHYAPQGVMAIASGAPEAVRAAVQAAVDDARRRGEPAGVLCCDEHAKAYSADAVIALGPRAAPAAAAQALYAALRECDARGLRFIAAEAFPEEGIGAALMNRMRKAAGGRALPV